MKSKGLGDTIESFTEYTGIKKLTEYTFNKIQALEGMVQYLQGAVDAGDIQVVKETTAAIADYLPKFIEEYDEASKRAWNNTVLKLDKPKERSPMDEYDDFENPVGHLNPL